MTLISGRALGRWKIARGAFAAACVTLLLSGGALVLAQTPAAQAAGDDSLEARVSAALADDAIQRSIPEKQSDPPPEWLIALLSALAPIAPVLMWGLAIVAAVIFLGWLGMMFMERWGRTAAPRSTGAAASAAAGRAGRTRVALDPERLAADGRFAEAIHALLLLAIDDLAARAATPPGPAATSRELVREFEIEETRRAAFAALVRAVEFSLFGGVAAGAEDFDRCRTYWKVLRGQGAA